MESRLQLGDFGVFRSEPSGPPKAGIVLLQEIFGVNLHIRENARRWSSFGYDVAAPALFDPVEKNVELGYTSADFPKGRDLVQKLGLDKALEGVQLTIDFLRAENRRVFVMGYCWGGSLAFLAATRLRGLDAAVSYYGRLVFEHRDEKPRVPVMFHYGRKDHGIPMEQVEAVKAALPGSPVYVYEAGHGFNCDHRTDFDESSARLAEQRTIALFEGD